MDEIKINSTSAEKAMFIVDDKKSEGNEKSFRKNLKLLTVIYAVFALLCVITWVKTGEVPVFSFIILLFGFIFTMADGISKSKKHSAATFNSFYFFNDRYINFDRLSQTAIPYELVISASETDEFFKICFDAKRCHVILKSAITLGTAEELSTFLSARIKKYKKLTKGKKI